MTGELELAAILAAGEPERLYSGLSVLVSSAATDVRCSALATFRALDLIMDPDLLRRAQEPDLTPALSWAGRETFAKSLVSLLETALTLEQLSVYACSASVETMNLTSTQVCERLDGVISTPRFIEESIGARLIFV